MPEEFIVKSSISPSKNQKLVDFVGVFGSSVVAHTGQMSGLDASVILEISGIVKVVTSEDVPRLLCQNSQVFVQFVPPLNRVPPYVVPVVH